MSASETDHVDKKPKVEISESQQQEEKQEQQENLFKPVGEVAAETEDEPQAVVNQGLR